MGRVIMRKCGGLSLAVKSIASLLRHETDEEGWREILESDLWESNPSNDIFPTLQISYAHLPTHLRPCFLFCSMYPKDYLLKKMNLIELWISHGYIEPRVKRRITDIGVKYYEELTERSFLDDFSNRNSECCKLHDIIHDLARLNSENEHYSVDIYEPFDIKKGSVLREAYHLYAEGNLNVNQILQQNLKSLRTLSMKYWKYWGDEAICNLTKFQALRVLELDGEPLTEFPPSISKLKHLSHLSFTSTYLKKLPLSIGLLYNLQTLILYCRSLKYLPENIGNLTNLRKLVIKSEYLEEVPTNLKYLCNLYELTIIYAQIKALPDIGGPCNLEELNLLPRGLKPDLEELFSKDPKCPFTVNGMLDYVPHGLVNFSTIKTMTARLKVRTIAWLKDMKNLEGKLSIEGLERMSNLVDVQSANLRNKHKLETLNLCWDFGILPCEKSELILSIMSEACEGGLVGAGDVDFSLLESLQPHSNLKKLRIRKYCSATFPRWMMDLFSLQSIQEVWLECCDNINSLPFGRSLQTLKHLTICHCSSIKVLQLERLPAQLEKLQILMCDHLELITGLGDLSMLATLKIFSCGALKSLTMDEQHLVKSIEPFGDSHFSRQSVSALTKLQIIYCGLLCVLPDGLIPSGPCYVFVSGCGCPDIEIGHLQ